MVKKKKRRGKKEEKIEDLPMEISSDLFNRFINDLNKNEYQALTPYTVSQIYDIKISLARKMLREAAKRGLLKLYSGGRTPIYIKTSP